MDNVPRRLRSPYRLAKTWVNIENKAAWYCKGPLQNDEDGPLYDEDAPDAPLYDDDPCWPSLPESFFDVRAIPTERELQMVTDALARYNGPPLVTVSALEGFLRELAEELIDIPLH
ncbi:MAG TPA: hypothetical protein VMV45_21290 [Casimicrobiaceae bacterium]|nr:hypothetical protein [Casimicrobiaceae bacterium]